MSQSHEDRSRSRRVLVLSLGIPLLLAALVILPNAGPVFRVFSIPAASMAPTLPLGSYAVASRVSYGYSRYSFDVFELPIDGRWPASMPRRGDMVLFRLPRDHKTFFVKRVIGLPGDRVQMIKGRLSINGQLVPREPAEKIRDPDPASKKAEVATYIERLADGPSYRIIEVDGDNGSLDNTPVFTVPPGHLFMLGDNRDNSTDSRRVAWGIGYVPVELVLGRVVATFPGGIL